jgi:UDP-glucose 4-epimerase
MANWLVTGGCGFIGSHLVEALLARGDRVRVLDNLSSGKRENLPPGVQLVVGDVADPACVFQALAGMDGCFHLAAVASVQRCTEDWIGTHRTNLTGTITVFEAAKRLRPAAPFPVIYASSAAVYGGSNALPLKETTTPRPLSAYGADKLGCEAHAQAAWSVHQVPNVGLRFFNVYGPRQDPSSPYSGVIAIFADRIAKGKSIAIFGDGHQTRDFVFAADVVAHLLAALANLHGGAQVFNVCSGHGTSILELSALIAEIAGHRPGVRHLPARAGDIRASIGDPSLAIAGLGLSARTQMAAGLRETLRFVPVPSIEPKARQIKYAVRDPHVTPSSRPWSSFRSWR